MTICNNAGVATRQLSSTPLSYNTALYFHLMAGIDNYLNFFGLHDSDIENSNTLQTPLIYAVDLLCN